jgi:hypothetical protein
MVSLSSLMSEQRAPGTLAGVPAPGRNCAWALLEVQAAAGVESQIDMFGWVRESGRGAVHTQPVTLGARRDGSDATIAFLGEVDAIAADVEITLAGGFSAAVIPLTAVTP